MRNLAFISAMLLVIVLFIGFLYFVRAFQTTGTAVASHTPTATALATATLTATATPPPTQTSSPTPSPTPTGLYVNSKYKFSVTLPSPYRKSTRVSQEFAGQTRPAAQDVFTARTEQDENSIDTSGCHTACPLWQYVAYIVVNTGTGTETPREYYAKQGGAVGQVIEDTTVDGRTAIKVTNGVPFPMQFIIKDGDRIFVVAYQIYPPENGMAIPPGATKEKLEAILASFKFLP